MKKLLLLLLLFPVSFSTTILLNTDDWKMAILASELAYQEGARIVYAENITEIQDDKIIVVGNEKYQNLEKVFPNAEFLSDYEKIIGRLKCEKYAIVDGRYVYDSLTAFYLLRKGYCIIPYDRNLLDLFLKMNKEVIFLNFKSGYFIDKFKESKVPYKEEIFGDWEDFNIEMLKKVTDRNIVFMDPANIDPTALSTARFVLLPFNMTRAAKACPDEVKVIEVIGTHLVPIIYPYKNEMNVALLVKSGIVEVKGGVTTQLQPLRLLPGRVYIESVVIEGFYYDENHNVSYVVVRNNGTADLTMIPVSFCDNGTLLSYEYLLLSGEKTSFPVGTGKCDRVEFTYGKNLKLIGRNLDNVTRVDEAKVRVDSVLFDLDNYEFIIKVTGEGWVDVQLEFYDEKLSTNSSYFVNGKRELKIPVDLSKDDIPENVKVIVFYGPSPHQLIFHSSAIRRVTFLSFARIIKIALIILVLAMLALLLLYWYWRERRRKKR